MDFCEIKHLILHLYIRITLDIHKYIITYTALKSGFFFRTGIKDFVFLKIFLKKRCSAMQAHLICTRSLIIRIYKCPLFDRVILNFAAFWPLETKYRVTHIPIHERLIYHRQNKLKTRKTCASRICFSTLCMFIYGLYAEVAIICFVGWNSRINWCHIHIYR